eukprot:scaffold385421_cov17-Prasinocladus_malaysianus.AAC.1
MQFPNNAYGPDIYCKSELKVLAMQSATAAEDRVAGWQIGVAQHIDGLTARAASIQLHPACDIVFAA